ncbi:hypothetical protein NHQ30_003848 [Ciborinia camelliae]|nr:hypothetical protein NHQ30_003848 [Ciborinia camelliae]
MSAASLKTLKAVKVMIPGRGNGVTLKDQNQRKRYRGYNLEEHQTVYDDFARFILENAYIDEADAHSYHHKTDLVEDLGNKGEDEEGFDIVLALKFDVMTPAIVAEEAVSDGNADSEDLDGVLGKIVGRGGLE